MIQTTDYKQYKMQKLHHAGFAHTYLETALEEYRQDGDSESFLLALRDVIEAQGGMQELSNKINIPKQSLTKVLSKNGNPRLDALDAILEGLGFRLSIEPFHT